MNQILQLKGKFEQRKNPNKPGPLTLPKGKFVTAAHIHELSAQLYRIHDFWVLHPEIAGALVSVHYTQVVAKSNRLRILLAEKGHNPGEGIRGAKFVWESQPHGEILQKHVFTYYIPLETLQTSISLLNKTASIIQNGYHGTIHDSDFDRINHAQYLFQDVLPKSAFSRVVLDAYYTQRFDIDRAENDIREAAIVTLYRTRVDTKTLLSKFGIHLIDDRIMDGNTIQLSPDELSILMSKAPYLISMNVTDMSTLVPEVMDGRPKESECIIPRPGNEPVVGVIDTQFDQNVYFSDWVEYRKMVDPDIVLTPEDYKHGTWVSSIIVDGPKGNPKLEDGCGRFRVRHFGVATSGRFSSFRILKQIREIVSQNRDIKVWNLSLGSARQISKNFISPEAAELDRIQNEFDVLFVVAGTNLPASERGNRNYRIGSPADSLNAVVVNAVDFANKSASYTRVGPVLSFFNKPDVSYYGGDGIRAAEKIVVCDSTGASYVSGTSFAAPWITRKMAYLINIVGLSREVAKALLVDSAIGWNERSDCRKGYGVVPINIHDIMGSADDEIRFVLTGSAEDFETYNYNLPVPIINKGFPFWARATLVYNPPCDRNQGADYTSTEMDIHFGRISVSGNKACIKSIDNNMQSEDGLHVIYEIDARKMYRKWDNIKCIAEKVTSSPRPRKVYESGMWGISIKTKERTASEARVSLPFGIVVTLKEMYGKNRIDDFIKLCQARGWLVNNIDIQNRLDVYAQAEEEIHLE